MKKLFGLKTDNLSVHSSKKPKEKKSFWSHFFEPVPEDQDGLCDFDVDDDFDGRQYGEPPQPATPARGFTDEELEFSEQEDRAAVASLIWSDGEPVLNSIPDADKLGRPHQNTTRERMTGDSEKSSVSPSRYASPEEFIPKYRRRGAYDAPRDASSAHGNSSDAESSEFERSREDTARAHIADDERSAGLSHQTNDVETDIEYASPEDYLPKHRRNVGSANGNPYERSIEEPRAAVAQEPELRQPVQPATEYASPEDYLPKHRRNVGSANGNPYERSIEEPRAAVAQEPELRQPVQPATEYASPGDYRPKRRRNTALPNANPYEYSEAEHRMPTEAHTAGTEKTDNVSPFAKQLTNHGETKERTWADVAAEQPTKEIPNDFEGYEENFRLFDDDDADTTARRNGDTTRTRIFRTGTDSTTRIHLNETEETLRIENAERKARARAAHEKHEAYVEKKNKHKKRQATLKKLFGNVAFVLFFIVAMLVALYYGFLLSDIVVMGNETYESGYIIKQSGLKLGRHMLLCNLDEAKENISEDPYIQVEQINYIFPSRIRIIVTERKEVAGIIGLDYNVIIDKNGYVLSMSGGTDLSNLMQVTGISMTGFQLGQRLGEGNDFSTATLIQIIDKLELYELMDEVKAIDLTTPLAITMTAKNGMKVHLGQSTDLDAKMASLKKLLPQFLKQDINVGTLYLSAKGGTVYSPPSAETSVVPGTVDTDNPTIPVNPNAIDDNKDGFDDLTGEPIGTPQPGTTPTPIPTSTPRVPGGASDDFSG
ncbi:MAG: FtsQ-type POTRA domain-containing protein [Clostridia bacterium]